MTDINTEEAPTTPLEARLHAVTIADDGVANTLSFRTTRELTRALEVNPGLKVLAVFKGKKLAVTEKISFNFC